MGQLALDFGEDGLVRRADGDLVHLCGIDPSNLDDLSIFDLVAGSDIPVVLEALSAMTSGIESSFFEARLLTHRGELRPMLWRAHRDDGGVIRARCSESRRRRTQRLRDAEERLRMALTIAEGGAWEVNARGELWIDPTFAALFDLPSGDAEPTWADLARNVAPEDRARFVAALEVAPLQPIDLEVRVVSDRRPVPRHVALRARLADAGARDEHLVGVGWNITSTKLQQAELVRLAMFDQLTGIRNRRAFERAVEEHWSPSRRANDVVSFLMIDVDHFKRFNDEQGHAAGDAALVVVARSLEAEVRRTEDVVARYGGEEFVVMLPGTTAEGARAVAQRMIANNRAPTISLGHATSRPDDESPWAVLRRADAACYRARADGRDRAVTG